jgi:hypothetical protein
LEERPQIVVEQWITVGAKKAVVSAVHEGAEADCTVVYLDGRNRPMYAEVVWTERGWEFVKSAGSSGPAQNDPRWRDYVTILRAGIHASPPSARRQHTPQQGGNVKPLARR